MNPAGLLAHCLAQFGGEMAARGDQIAGIVAQPQEAAAPALPGNQQPQFVIFGQAFGGERPGLALGDPSCRQCLKRVAGKPAADARGGKPCSDSITHRQQLGMRFGEFIGIVARNPARGRLRLRPDRELDEINRSQSHVDGCQRRRMDHILGIVEHHTAELDVAAQFIDAQRGIKPVEAIRFGRGSLPVMDYQSDAGIFADPGNRSGNRCRVIAVAANINAQLGLRPGRQRMSQRGANHRRFLPRRNQDRRPPDQRLGAIAPRQPRRAQAAVQLEP